jgi:hypothetical protein
VTTILPEAKINAVVLGSRILIITAAKRYKNPVSTKHNVGIQRDFVGIGENTFGLYSALRACRAMVFKSRRQSRLTVATMFL